MIYPRKVRDAAKRAADWLEANPDKHIKGLAVTDDKGNSIENPQAKNATCFCAIGALAREAGLRAVTKDGEYVPIDNLLGSSERTNRMFGMNDYRLARGIEMLRAVERDEEIA